MNIVFDGQIYTSQTTGGISRYFTNLITYLPDNVYPKLTISYKENYLSYPDHQNQTTMVYRDFWPSKISDRIRSYWAHRAINLSECQIYHPTYYTQLARNSLQDSRKPIVITVFDMIHELFSETLETDRCILNAKRKAINRADAIICISQSTKRDLLKYYPHVEKKIAVTYLASELSRSWSFGDEAIPSRPYFLYVGSRAREYKNFETLLQAFHHVASIDSNVMLAVVGAPFNKDECKYLKSLKLEGRIKHFEFVKDTHLAKLYRCSIAFVYPSLYEGFGIPPLEAMICGTAVVASASSSIPEVVGTAALLFDPVSVDELTDRLFHVLNCSEERAQLIEKGYKRAQNFSWKETAEKTVRVYEHVAQS